MSRKSKNNRADGTNAKVSGAQAEAPQLAIAPLKPMASAKEIARLLRRRPRTIHEWRRQGKIPYYRIEQTIVFDWDEVKAHLAKTCHVPATNLPTQEPQR